MDRFGPNSAAVEAMLDRATRLTESEGLALWDAHLEERSRDSLFLASLSAVVDASHVSGRHSHMRLAERVGRSAVSIFPGTSLGHAIGGCVGRLAEALVIADRIDAASIAPLTQPWIKAVGPLDAT